MRSAIVLTVLVVGSFGHALTQQPTLQPGRRVRVTCPTTGLWQASANFQRLQGDSLVLLVRSAPVDARTRGGAPDSTSLVTVPVSGITSLEAYRGRGRSTLRILLFGAGGTALGAGIGWRIGKAIDDSCKEGLCLDLAEGWGLGLGAAVGLVTGVVVGSLIKTDKWEAVPLNALQVSLVPRRDGFGVGARVSF